MNNRIPLSALVLGASGLIPFLWGVASMVAPPPAGIGLEPLGSAYLGAEVIVNWGKVILAFMSGVLWGFATRAQGWRAVLGYAVSVIPAIWVFFLPGDGLAGDALALLAGFVGLLALDWAFAWAGLAPAWWMRLRIGLTAVVAACLLPVVLG
ncbi:DUF3429 domain-containing protein [Candidatus Falkowbacteria bacterium]|nr:DUF3429 domain-containing protein [Candidatus Falkowbacteria bacterium]